MTIRRTVNPQNFCKEANKLNIRYEFLIEGKNCIGDQSLARLFNGSSMRGGGGSISAGTINNWIATFEFIQKNPEHIDNEQYVVHRLEPKKEYNEYLEIIKTPIKEEIIDSWKNLSYKKLGDEAIKYGMTLGVRNTIAVKTLLERMLKMVDRRKENIWCKDYENIDITDDIDYRFTNVPELRRLCKEKNIKNAHIHSKDELVKVLEENERNSIYVENKKEHKDLNVKELKSLAKERGLTCYNNLKKDELLKLHDDFDEDIKMIEENTEIIENNEINEGFLKVFTFDNKQIRTAGTYDKPLFVVKDIADILELTNYKNVYSKMDDYMKKDDVHFMDSIGRQQQMQVVNESGLYYMIMRSNKPNAKIFQKAVYQDILPSIRKTGSFTLENKYKFILENNRPLSQLLNSNNFDKEAQEIESVYDWCKNSNNPVIYVAYIGSVDNNGLIKVGFSDSKFDDRLSKHISSESQYEQFRILDTFEVSGKPIEDILHGLLQVYRHPFKVQKEIYKTPSTLKDFVNIIQRLLDDNDYKLKYNKISEKYNELSQRYSELEKKYKMCKE